MKKESKKKNEVLNGLERGEGEKTLESKRRRRRTMQGRRPAVLIGAMQTPAQANQ